MSSPFLQKMVFEGVDIDKEAGTRTIIRPEWSVKVTTKNDVYDDKEKLKTFVVRRDQDGYMTAIDYENDAQIKIEELHPEAAR